MLPLPYGLLTHELIEVLDSERILPGLCLVSKIAEDFPYIDYHSRQKEKPGTKFHNYHQDIFVFTQFGSKSEQELKMLYKEYVEVGSREAGGDGREPAHLIKEFRTYNHYRYTFLRNLFQHYDMLHDMVPNAEVPITFDQHLQEMPSSLIWNVYKHVT